MSNLAKSLSKTVMRWRFSAYDQYVSIYKSPVNSKIVVYGAYNQLFSQLLNRNFEKYNIVDPNELSSQSNENDNGKLESIAQAMVGFDESFNSGYFIKDFPQTPDQAARLDVLLDGINLAVNIQLPENAASNLSGKYLECKSCGQIFNTALESTYPHLPGTTEGCPTPTRCDIVESTADVATRSTDYISNYQPVLEYYEKRGLLLNFIVDEKWSFQETINRLRDQILASVKL